MNLFIHSNSKTLFYLLWFIALLLQAYFTGLTPDEAYYWLYSEKPAWGYFDHPPVIAWLVKAGYFLFHNELGVRLIPVILSTCTLYLWEKIIQPKETRIFFLLVVSAAILHFTGFFATPDSPFILFASAYFLLYRRFIAGPGIKNSVLLGMVIALMLLSKYHGIIIIGLTLLSSPKLFMNKFFWLVTATALLLMIPHFSWQYSSGFPSVKYHLFERSVALYAPAQTFEYLAAQVFVFGPFTGIFLFIACVRERSGDQFEKTLKFIFWGGYIFFFLMTFKGRVEAHWTLFTVIPGFYFACRFLTRSIKAKQIFTYLAFISVVLIVAARIIVTIDYSGKSDSFLSRVTKNFHNKSRMLAIKEQANGCPVAFMNSYQDASLYSFYSESDGFSLNNTMGRKNQFDTWNTEDIYRGQTIMMIPNYDAKEFSFIRGFPSTRYIFIENFQSFSKVKIEPVFLPGEAKVSDTLSVKVFLTNTASCDFEANPALPSFVYYQFFEGNKPVKENEAAKISNQTAGKVFELKVVVPEKKGMYGLYFSIKTGWLPPTINSGRYKIQVTSMAD